MSPAARKTPLIAVALAAILGATAALADESTIWLNVEVNESGTAGPKVKIQVPISLIEVVVDSLDTTDVMHHLGHDKDIDLAKLWKHLRDADVDEFVHIERDGEQIKVFKDRQALRVTAQEEGFDEPNVKVRIPFAVMDFLADATNRKEFRFSDLLEQLRGNLPFVLVEAERQDEHVRIWLEER